MERQPNMKLPYTQKIILEKLNEVESLVGSFDDKVEKNIQLETCKRSMERNITKRIDYFVKLWADETNKVIQEQNRKINILQTRLRIIENRGNWFTRLKRRLV